jgi:CTP synthase
MHTQTRPGATPADGTRYIFVTGGVVSSLGKGIVAASLAKLLQARNLRVTIQKLDPYINVDPGTMNPYEHGEVYVTEDGAETDLDLGHYERFLNVPTSQANNVTTGRIYQDVIKRERDGGYKGKTVQVVPHITDEIKRRIQLLGETGNYDIVITEIGGTVGDIESLPFIEAIRQLHYELGHQRSIFLHLTLVPFLAAAGELKTKPTQYSVKQLLESGIQAHIIVCRTEQPLLEDIRQKIALFCNVPRQCVIEARDARSIYEVPLRLRREALDEVVLEQLGLPVLGEPDLTDWREFLRRLGNPSDEVTVALVGKYVELPDAYKSIQEALTHAGAWNEVRVKVHRVHSEDLNEENVSRLLGEADAVLVAPGFGNRGISGKISAVHYARTREVPFLGICLGMQMACIEFGRNVLGLTEADSTEMNPHTPHPVICLMEEQAQVTQLGGTMRLGAYDCHLEPQSRAHRVYKQTEIQERHRHRFEFNNRYREQYEAAGFKASGTNPDNGLVELIELPEHPFFMASQFHPEYRSTVLRPHPLFTEFVRAAVQYRSARRGTSRSLDLD